MQLVRSRSTAFLLAAVVGLTASCAAPTEIPVVMRQGPAPAAATVPAQGTSSTLDVANWNIEWFGSSSNGPTNDALQVTNVGDVIAGADLDVWGLQEVVDAVEWGQLKTRLTGYAGVLSNESAVTGGSSWYTSTEQKVALLWKTSLASLVSAKIILTANDYDFAGRPPMEVTLRVTLNGVTEDVVFIVLHMKAFNDEASRTRRQNAANALKSYLDATYPTQKVFVIGDWNDDLDTSITPGAPTPYAQFNNDPARYTWPTRALTNAGISTTVGYPDAVDHQLHTNELNAQYQAGSVTAFRADQYITDYANTTTDHYPVYSRYTWGTAGAPAITVTAPNGGESWQVSSVQNITWTSANVSTVRLEYTLNNGTSWTTITASTSAAAGSYSWTLPSTTSTSAKVRVTDTGSSTTDMSNAVFSIVSGPPPAAQVIINEIMANEPGSSTAGEFVELVNVGGSDANIGGWTISDNSSVRHTFASGTILAAGKAIVVFGGASAIPGGLTNAVAASTGGLSLNNSSDSVILKNGATTVNSFAYTSSLSGTDGVSMNRNPDASATGTFVLHTAISSLKGSAGTRASGAAF